jgi:hypothetical protein
VPAAGRGGNGRNLGHQDRQRPKRLDELPACIPAVAEHRDPGVLVDVVAPSNRGIALPLREDGIDDPHAMQLPADVIRVQVVRQQEVVHADLLRSLAL